MDARFPLSRAQGWPSHDPATAMGDPGSPAHPHLHAPGRRPLAAPASSPAGTRQARVENTSGPPRSCGVTACSRPRTSRLAETNATSGPIQGRHSCRIASWAASRWRSPIPSGQRRSMPSTLAKFISYCRRQDWAFGIYQASPTAYRLGRGQGLRGFKIGEDALVDLRSFTLEGKAGAAVRHSVARARRGGLTVRLFHGRAPA